MSVSDDVSSGPPARSVSDASGRSSLAGASCLTSAGSSVLLLSCPPVVFSVWPATSLPLLPSGSSAIGGAHEIATESTNTHKMLPIQNLIVSPEICWKIETVSDLSSEKQNDHKKTSTFRASPTAHSQCIRLPDTCFSHERETPLRKDLTFHDRGGSARLTSTIQEVNSAIQEVSCSDFSASLAPWLVFPTFVFYKQGLLEERMTHWY